MDAAKQVSFDKKKTFTKQMLFDNVVLKSLKLQEKMREKACPVNGKKTNQYNRINGIFLRERETQAEKADQ